MSPFFEKMVQQWALTCMCIFLYVSLWLAEIKYVYVCINLQKTKDVFICFEPEMMSIDNQSVDHLDDLCYVIYVMASSVNA